MLWWHHHAGPIFGLFTFTWALSGALSLTPWDWAPGTAPTAQQAAAVAGGPLRLDALTVPALRAAAAAIGREFAPKELDILQFAGAPVMMAYRPPSVYQPARWTNPDLRAIVSAQLPIDHRLVRVASPEDGSFTRFPDDAVLAAARAAMPGVPIEDAAWLESYDAYYYDRHGAKALPMLRVRFQDAARTWLYVDPRHGLISLRHETLSRANRWLYHGLHSLDFPFLYRSRPAWDLVVVILSAGGILLSVTTMTAAWRRLQRHARSWRPATRLPTLREARSMRPSEINSRTEAS